MYKYQIGETVEATTKSGRLYYFVIAYRKYFNENDIIYNSVKGDLCTQEKNIIKTITLNDIALELLKSSLCVSCLHFDAPISWRIVCEPRNTTTVGTSCQLFKSIICVRFKKCKYYEKTDDEIITERKNRISAGFVSHE